MRCLFTMFAEDVELLPKHGFRDMLKALDDPAQFKPMAEDLWRQMNVGGFSAYFRKKLLQFNGGLFADPSALAVSRDQLDLLIEAADKDWRDVEPAIFGTLLERALDPVERHKLGAHYTPRAYVERLVMPTIVEPLRAEWDNVRTAAILHAQQDKRDEAVKEIEAFHDRLCETRVLDPACGTGNFLYVTLEHLKRIEGEVFSTYESIAQRQMLLEGGHTVDPHQLLGIEINPRAAAITDLVLWIGYLQWHFRTRGNVNPPEPVIKNFKNIECRDALLTWTSREPLLDDKGKPVTHWDGRTTKKHPVTGEEVPDETAREISYKYNNAKKAEWPKANYVVGNPPFIGNKLIVSSLGEGYADALRATHTEVPDSADFVMYWWNHSAELTASKDIARFGLITTNSITQNFNRRVLAKHLTNDGVSLVYVIPDHPWVDSALAAGVRISMTVAERGNCAGQLCVVESEGPSRTGNENEESVSLSCRAGRIHANLTIGTDLTSAVVLKSNLSLCGQGVKLVGDGFYVDDAFELGPNSPASGYPIVRRIISPTDLLKGLAGRNVIDFFGLDEQQARRLHSKAFQQLLTRVKPLRDQNRRESIKKLWWRFAWERPVLREAIKSQQRYFVTLETSKHRFFGAIPGNCLWDGSLFAIASEDFYVGGVLGSRIHVTWAFHTGGRLEDRPRYNGTQCFEKFPFPNATENQKSRIRELGEQLDAHRKRQQELHPTLTMPVMYNVLEKLRAGEPLTTKEQTIHEQGLVSVLCQIHDDLDAAVSDAYGWPVDLADEGILARLVALNHERAEEERRGTIRWLRPDFQNPSGAKQTSIAVTDETTTPAAKQKAKRTKKQKWPKALSEQAGAVHAALAAVPTGATAEDIGKFFLAPKPERVERIAEILETLAALGKARELAGDRYIAM